MMLVHLSCNVGEVELFKKFLMRFIALMNGVSKLEDHPLQISSI